MINEYYQTYCDNLGQMLAAVDRQALERIYQKLADAYEHDRQVFVIGNGGSAASATHWVCDMGKGINTPNSRRLKIICPSDHTAILTAVANDIAYEEVFSYQLDAAIQPDDVLIALSVSGNSPNLLKAMDLARQKGAEVISIVGDLNGQMITRSDIALVVPSQNYGLVEDFHMIINHVFSQYIKELNLKAQEARR